MQAKFSAKPAMPVVKLPDGTTAKSGDTYTYYDAADISAVAPDGVEIRYSANAPFDGALGTKLGKGETFTVSNGDGHVQITYLRARKTLQSGDQTYTCLLYTSREYYITMPRGLCQQKDIREI